jgi:hypothetical protein
VNPGLYAAARYRRLIEGFHLDALTQAVGKTLPKNKKLMV